MRYALRMMRGSVGLTAVAILSLALGIGTTSAIFSVVHALLLKPLPVMEPDQLAEVASPDGANRHSYAEWREFRDRQDIFSGTFAFNWVDTEFNLGEGEEKQTVSGLYVTGDFFHTLGVPAILGRTLRASDDHPGSGPVCVLGYGLWRREYGQSPSVVGHTVLLNGHPFNIVGVAPRSFFGVQVGDKPEVFVPLEMERIFQDYQMLAGHMTPALDDPSATLLKIIGRLKPGVSVSQANTRLQVLGSEIDKALPPIINDRTGRPFPPGTFVARPMPNGISYTRYVYGNTVVLLLLMAGVVLVITCTNLGNLLLARAMRRQGEIATRLALGATRRRLVRQLLTESVALSAAGGAVGLVFAHWGSDVLVSAISSPGESTYLDLSWDPKLVMFIAGIIFSCALLFGLAPAVRATDVSLYSAMKNGSTLGTGRHRFSNAVLIVAQVTLSMALIISAGLLVRTLHALVSKNPGYEARGVLVVEASSEAKKESAQRQGFEGDELLTRFGFVPGVISASWSTSTSGADLPTVIVPRAGGPGSRYRSFVFFISPGFFRTRRTPVLSGRDFDAQDNNTSLPVAILSEQAAKTFFPGANVVGLRYREGDGEGDGQEYSVQIVGVVKDIDYQRPNDAPLPVVYRPISQCALSCSALGRYELRFASPLPNMRKRLQNSAASVDPQLILSFHLLSDELNNVIQRNRLTALIATFFGLLTGVLAMIGVYGVTSYATSQRTREIGIRMALGAQPGDVFRMILWEAIVIVFVALFWA
ncbi:MAG: ABC transporter permease [Candidatus Acidiferrales bacterium]